MAELAMLSLELLNIQPWLAPNQEASSKVVPRPVKYPEQNGGIDPNTGYMAQCYGFLWACR